MRMYGSMKPCVQVQCLGCQALRWYPMSTLRGWMKKHSFSGLCRSCQTSNLEHRRRCVSIKHGGGSNSGRSVGPAGYVLLRLSAIEDEDVWLFDVLRGRATFVLEHRFAMSKHLGRPLRRDENVDHMDGDKTNNDVSNLRLYRTGKNEPGSCPGYGTYYHEWQMALARIAELEAALS